MRDHSYVWIFRSLAEETRFAIHKVIVENKRINRSEIGTASPIGKSPISLHLKELRIADRISQKRRATLSIVFLIDIC